jgi:DNA repair exonuclease SbcCD ATPase subunit
LKDTGIKSKIIKQYISIINKLINKFLIALDLMVQFELDENFNEIIKSRYRDEFSYFSFSEGEKQKIDVALLFTWRAVAKMRNSAATNLLIMDEIFDSSLDSVAVDNLMDIIKQISTENNIFVISHKEVMVDKFKNIIKFVKQKNFSKIT